MTDFEGLEQYPIDLLSLPGAWAISSLGQSGCVVESGFASGKHNSAGDGVPHLRPMNVSRGGRIDLDVLKSVAADASVKRLSRGDVLFNNTNSPALVGKTAYVGLNGDWAYSNHMTRIRSGPPFDAQFLAHQLHFCWATGYFGHICTNHVNQASVSSARLAAAVPMVIPPLPEQRRIVAAIEEYFSRLDAAEVNLNSAKLRTRFLAQSLIDSSLRGPPTRLADVLAVPLRNGLSAKTSATGEIRVLTLTAVTAGCFEDRNTKLIDLPERSIEDLWLQADDIFVQRSNTPELVGTAAIYRGPHRWAIFPDLLIRVRVNEAARADYVALVLRSSAARSYFRRSAQGIVGSMPKISQPVVEQVVIPLPSVREQTDVMRSYGLVQDEVVRLERQADTALKRLRSLRRSILAAAFSGQLVPQDPTDEPASVLLERIAAERAATTPTRRRKQVAS